MPETPPRPRLAAAIAAWRTAERQLNKLSLNELSALESAIGTERARRAKQLRMQSAETQPQHGVVKVYVKTVRTCGGCPKYQSDFAGTKRWCSATKPFNEVSCGQSPPEWCPLPEATEEQVADERRRP